MHFKTWLVVILLQLNLLSYFLVAILALKRVKKVVISLRTSRLPTITLLQFTTNYCCMYFETWLVVILLQLILLSYFLVAILALKRVKKYCNFVAYFTLSNNHSLTVHDQLLLHVFQNIAGLHPSLIYSIQLISHGNLISNKNSTSGIFLSVLHAFSHHS